MCPPCHASQEAILVHLPLKLKLMWFPHGMVGGGGEGAGWANMSGMNPSLYSKLHSQQLLPLRRQQIIPPCCLLAR